MSSDSTQWCNSPDHVRPGHSRREFMYVGLIGGLGLTLPEFLRMQSTARGAEAANATWAGNTAQIKPTAQSCIHIFMPGGMAHQESWDPKPLAPIEYRGPLGTVKTKLEGEVFSEYLQELAGVSDKICVIRSMTHGEAAHERGTHNMFTGYRPSPALSYPSFGSVVSHELGVRKNMPPYVCIPSMSNPYAGSGYLSAAYGPFSLGSDPSATGSFKVRDLSLANGIDDARFDRRKGILAAVDNHFRTIEKSDALDAMDSFYQNAYALISSKEAREAFDLAAESEQVKEAYGKNSAGMRLLMARRLVQAGVRFVSTTYGGWDHHSQVKNGFKTQMPPFDKALAALIRDLDQRGMLDSTLIMVSSEFGRSTKVNKDEGRDHWPKVFSVMLAGGGIKKGVIYGSSDATAAEPADKPVGIEDLAKTIYNRLGINAEKKLLSPGDRPIDIVRGGKLLEEIMV